jgi:class 3 adenylate cyclase
MFLGCNSAQLRLLDSLLCETRVGAGRVLVREDLPAEQMVLVMDGRARIARHGETFGLADRGAVVGARELRDRTTYAVTMTADTPMTVRVANARELLSVIDLVPDLEVALWGSDVHGSALIASSIGDEVEAYLRAWTEEPDRVLAALMFTDIVHSTHREAVGDDHAWSNLLDAFHGIVARQVVRYNGVIVSTFGDGALARFSCAYSAARCAWAIREELRDIGLEVQVGPRAGDVELQGPDISGVTVHIANRIFSATGGAV